MKTSLFSRSKKGALVMTAISIATALVTNGIWSLAVGRPLVPTIPVSSQPLALSEYAVIAVIALVMLATAALAFYLIYSIIFKLSVSHYGLRGAVGWAVVGCLGMLANRVIDLLVPYRAFWKNLPFGAALLLVYFMVFHTQKIWDAFHNVTRLVKK